MLHRSRSGASDGSLVQAARDGDPGAYAELISRYQRLVYGVAYARLWNHNGAEETARKTFLAAHLNLCRLREPNHFQSWLCRIAEDQTRLAWLRRKVESEVFARWRNPERIQVSPHHVSDHPELEVKLEVLNEAQRETATLYYMGGYIQEEVAEFLGAPLNTVKSRLQEVRDTLHQEVLDQLESSLRDRTLRLEFTAEVMAEVHQLWRQSFEGEEEEQRFHLGRLARLVETGNYDAKGVIVETVEGRLGGFAVATIGDGPKLWSTPDDDLGFISGMFVMPEYRRRGIGSRLLVRAEEFLASRGCTRVRVRPQAANGRIVAWGERSPSEEGGCPARWGVDLSSPAYPFLLNRGYKPSHARLALSWNIERLRMAEPVTTWRRTLEEAGIVARAALPEDMPMLLDCAVEAGCGAILQRSSDLDPGTLLIAVEGGQAVGFVGPNVLYDDGRSESIFHYVRPDYRRRRIGTVLTHLATERLSRRGGVEYRETCEADSGRSSEMRDFYLSQGLGFRVRYAYDPALTRELEKEPSPEG